MAKKEANFDLYIHQLLCEAGIKADTQGSNNVEIDNALKTASKHQTGKAGYPEYVAVVQDFVIVMEDKADRNNLWLKDDEDKILLSVSATRDYAVNGAVYYAKKIIEILHIKKYLHLEMQGIENIISCNLFLLMKQMIIRFCQK